MEPVLASKNVLTENQLSAIGHVAVETTYCEHLLEQLIWILCNLEEDQGKFFTDRMLLDKRLELLGDLWKPQLSEAKSAELVYLISELKQANNDRNVIIHGYWNFPRLPYDEWIKGKEFPPATATRRRLRSEPLTFSSAEILKAAYRIADLSGKLFDFAAANGLYKQP